MLLKQDYNFNVYAQDAANCINNWLSEQKNKEMNERASAWIDEWMKKIQLVSVYLTRLQLLFFQY